MDADSSIPNLESRSRWTTAIWVLAALLLIGLVCAFVLQMAAGNRSQKLATSIALGERPKAPALPTKSLDGSESPAAFPGKILVVNFWASWCGPCREEAPELNQMAEDGAKDGVVVVGVNAASEDAIDDARDFVEEFDIAFPVVRGDRGEVNAWGVRGYPETFVVGRDGKLAAHIDGPLDAEALRATLDSEIERGSSSASTGSTPSRARTREAKALAAGKVSTARASDEPSLTPVPASERTTSLDAIAKLVVCPSCDAPLDRSESPSADRMRIWIKRRVDAGWTKSQILDGVVVAYGGDSAILGAPQAKSGRGFIAYIVPGIIAVIVLLVGITRLRRR